MAGAIRFRPVLLPPPPPLAESSSAGAIKPAVDQPSAFSSSAAASPFAGQFKGLNRFTEPPKRFAELLDAVLEQTSTELHLKGPHNEEMRRWVAEALAQEKDFLGKGKA